jgi:hypothetical protein
MNRLYAQKATGLVYIRTCNRRIRELPIRASPAVGQLTTMDAATAKADECLQSLSNSKTAWAQMGLAKKVALMKARHAAHALLLCLLLLDCSPQEVKARLLDYGLPLAQNFAGVKGVAGTQARATLARNRVLRSQWRGVRTGRHGV